MAYRSSISVRVKGDYNRTERFFKRLSLFDDLVNHILHKYGKMGVERLKDYTPKDTGKTSESWSYEIVKENGAMRLIFSNSNVVNDWANVAILIQYGHGTRNGGWVEGRDYINPALHPIFDDLAKSAWEEVKNS